MTHGSSDYDHMVDECHAKERLLRFEVGAVDRATATHCRGLIVKIFLHQDADRIEKIATRSSTGVQCWSHTE